MSWALARPKRPTRLADLRALVAGLGSAPVADGRQMAGVFMRLELTGAGLIGAWMVFPGDSGLGKGWLAVIVSAAVGQALGIGLIRRPLGVGVYSLLLGFAVALLGLGMYFSGGALSPVSLFYVWVVAFAGWYLPARHVWLMAVWIVASYGLALMAHSDPGKAHWWELTNADASRWLLLAGTTFATGLLVRTFRRALLDNEQRFLVAFARSATPMTLAGLDGQTIDANPAFCELLDRPAGELIGCSALETVYPADRQAAETFFDRKRGSTRIEMRLLRGDGTPVWVELASSVVSDHRGEPLYYFTQMLDITARRAAEGRAALQAAEHAAIAGIGRASIDGADPEALSDQIASIAADLLDLDLVVVLEHDSSPHTCRVIAAKGSSARQLDRGPQACWPVAEFTLAGGEPVVVEDWSAETRFPMSVQERRLSFANAAAVLVRGQREPFGALVCESRTPREFTVEDVNFLQGLANMLTATIEQRRAQDEAMRASLHDSLTGLPNRVLLVDLLRHSLTHPRGRRSLPAVAFIDLDHFKLVNDSLGHDAGDQLLRDVVARFSDALRMSDTLARFASDEFVVLCEDLSNERAVMRVAERILATLATPFRVAGEEITISATVGIAIAGEGDSAESLLRDAEAAMHRAKERSRGVFEMFDPQLHSRNIARLRSENALRRAIGTDELSLVYQPIIEPETGAINTVEALLRWRHPDWGPVSPAEFIPIAEESGMIIPIGRHVLSHSTRQLASWRSGGHQVRLSVNISARQFHDDALVELTAAMLERSALPPASLTLELTETALIADGELALRVLRAAKELGVLLALDDFGTGYAALSYLSRFPFDIVKLDRTLISMIGHSRKDEIIVASTIEMGHALGLTVVAEGVETDEQDAKLRDCGCDLVQGYFHARPVPPAELEALPGWTTLPPNAASAT